MDIRASQPVPGVPSPAETGRHPSIKGVVPQAVTPPQKPVALPPAGPDLQRTQQVIAELVQQYLHSTARNLEFQVDSDSGTAFIVVRDAEGNVIRRIPGEEALQQMLRQNAESGTFVDSTA